MSPIDLSGLYNFLYGLWLLFNEILAWVVILIALLSGFWMYNEFKPKPFKDPTTLELFIDDELGRLMERREIHISWGPILFLNELKLLRTLPETVVRLTSRSAGKLEIGLPEDCKRENLSRSKKIVYLRNRRYFRETNIDLVTAMLETQLGTAYRQNLHWKVSQLGNARELVITNDNVEEIRKYQLSVSKDIDPRDLDGAANHIESLKIEIPFSQFKGVVNTNLGQVHTLGLPILLEIQSIPGKRGNEAGRVRIPFRSKE